MLDHKIKVNGAIRESLTLESLEYSLLFPRKAVLREDGTRHDAGTLISNNDRIEISTDNFATRIFDGRIRLNNPVGIAKEGIRYVAYGPRQRLQDEICVRINGSYRHVYNPTGGHDSQAPGYGFYNYWTIGEVLIDILEHAMGLPEGASAIPTHHQDSSDVTNTYLPDSIIASYNASDILSLTMELPEIELNATRFAQAITLLLEIAGNVGWYIHPDTKELKIVKMSSATAVDISAGELGRWVDEDGKSYELMDNPMEFDLDGVYTKVVLQGRDKTREIRPAGLPWPFPQTGLGNAKLQKGWDPSLEASWNEMAFYNGEYAGDDTYEWVYRRFIPEPEGQSRWVDGVFQTTPLGYSGKAFYSDGGGVLFPCTRVTTGRHLTYLDHGVVLFTKPLPAPYRNKTFYAWYRMREPFVVSVGPSGSAYTNYGHVAELVIYDEAWEHITSRWPYVEGYNYGLSVRDDTGKMTAIANAIHSIYSKEKVSARIVVDGVDIAKFTLHKKVNFKNLSKWSDIGLHIFHIRIDPARDVMTLTVGNNILSPKLGGYEQMRLADQREALFRSQQRKIQILTANTVLNIMPG